MIAASSTSASSNTATNNYIASQEADSITEYLLTRKTQTTFRLSEQDWIRDEEEKRQFIFEHHSIIYTVLAILDWRNQSLSDETMDTLYLYTYLLRELENNDKIPLISCNVSLKVVSPIFVNKAISIF